jgi:hypothetical protein
MIDASSDNQQGGERQRQSKCDTSDNQKCLAPRTNRGDHYFAIGRRIPF